MNEIASTSGKDSNKIHDIAAKANWLNQLCDYLKSANIALYSYFNMDKETDWAVFNGGYGTDTYNGMNVYSEFKNYVSQPDFVSTLDFFYDCQNNKIQLALLNGDHGYFLSFSGNYLAADRKPNPFFNPLKEASSYCKIINHEDNLYSFKSNRRTYLSGKADQTVTLELQMESWEKWTVVKFGNHLVWRSFHGTHLNARPEGWMSLVQVVETFENWTQF